LISKEFCCMKLGENEISTIIIIIKEKLIEYAEEELSSWRMRKSRDLCECEKLEERRYEPLNVFESLAESGVSSSSGSGSNSVVTFMIISWRFVHDDDDGLGDQFNSSIFARSLARSHLFDWFGQPRTEREREREKRTTTWFAYGHRQHNFHLLPPK
jgi:hypothetical protein